MKKASQHFGDILSEFVGSLASMTEIADLPAHLKRACISYRGELTSLYEYIPRIRKSDPEEVQDNIANGVSNQRPYNILLPVACFVWLDVNWGRAPTIEAAGAIRAGRNPAKYKSNGDIIHVDGENLHDSATRFRVPNLPAFALECLPNRNSLVYGELYGIESQASTIFRGTLRYEGFSMIIATLSKLGFFDNED